MTLEEYGSSPRMWGTLVRRHPGVKILRFIPTHVGNTVLEQVRVPPLAVHPHACGEHILRDNWARNRGGSSPRMWGTRLVKE